MSQQTYKLTEQLENGFYRILAIRGNGRLVVIVFAPSGKRFSSREKLRSYLKYYKGAGIDPDIAFARPLKSDVISSSQKGSEGSTQGPKTNGSTEKSAPVSERPSDQSQPAKTKVTKNKRTKSDDSSQAPLDNKDTSQNLSKSQTETAVTNMLPPKNPKMVKAEMKADSEKENSRQKRVLRTKASNPNVNKDPEDSKHVSPSKKAKIEPPAGLKNGKPGTGPKQPKDPKNFFIEVEAPLKSPYKLIYEDLALEPWKVIVGSFLMNRTIAIKGCCLVQLFFEEFPSLDKLMNKKTLTQFFTGTKVIPCMEDTIEEILEISLRLKEGVQSLDEIPHIDRYTYEVFQVFCAGQWAQFEPSSLDLLTYVKWRRLQPVGGD
ncbi:uncharacterized protein LOC135946166 [Cloeon dipterum]|uniref:uncharacterized protein LOC135946166 n=1 Tax=Cloeon dipterum TaxID=197152 RepID=UPI0032205B9A